MSNEGDSVPKASDYAEDQDLTEAIERSKDHASPVQTTLKADGRVLARVTDGIYREPGSALRELISNAYDADASRVVISTDRPRFQRIIVEDDGAGMGPAAVAHLLHHIGGSAKRSGTGKGLGVTDATDSTLSPGGRRLIGKIGIGLFSVAQLTQSFQIITKRRGAEWRTVANVVLKHYADDPSMTDDDEYEAGRVTVWQERAHDTESHGTTIILNSIRPTTRETLTDAGAWTRVEEANAKPPRFHVGQLLPTVDGDALRIVADDTRHVPWTREDGPADAFSKLVDSVWGEVGRGERNPSLDHLFDYYLRMVWQISLSVPLPYVAGHPFDQELGAIHGYSIPSDRRRVERIDPPSTIRDALGWQVLPEEDGSFRVVIDDLELRRPLRFTRFPATSQQLRTPTLFAGEVREEFEGVPRELSGGPLAFRAYLLWAPKIAPTEHTGVLIRVHGASGTLFDRSFLQYQIAERTRLAQISGEIFVTEGFEAALNIDRESFNYAHPHVVRMTKWLHSALTRSITELKSLSSQAQTAARERASLQEADEIRETVRDFWRETGGEDEDIPEVKFTDDLADDDSETQPERISGYLLPRAKVLGRSAYSGGAASTQLERRLTAIVQILSSYDLLDRLSADERAELLAAIADVLRSGS